MSKEEILRKMMEDFEENAIPPWDSVYAPKLGALVWAAFVREIWDGSKMILPYPDFSRFAPCWGEACKEEVGCAAAWMVEPPYKLMEAVLIASGYDDVEEVRGKHGHRFVKGGNAIADMSSTAGEWRSEYAKDFSTLAFIMGGPNNASQKIRGWAEKAKESLSSHQLNEIDDTFVHRLGGIALGAFVFPVNRRFPLGLPIGGFIAPMEEKLFALFGISNNAKASIFLPCRQDISRLEMYEVWSRVVLSASPKRLLAELKLRRATLGELAAALFSAWGWETKPVLSQLGWNQDEDCFAVVSPTVTLPREEVLNIGNLDSAVSVLVKYTTELAELLEREVKPIPPLFGEVRAQDGDWELIQLTKLSEFYQEGEAMDNCVASYFSDIAREAANGGEISSAVFSLRFLGERVATIDISRSGGIIEIKRKHNKDPLPEDIEITKRLLERMRRGSPHP